LVAVMDRLRSPGGCPWDADQTHESLVEYLIEEAYEAVEAIDTNDRSALKEELGDLLLQVVFHSRIAEEDLDDPWNISDVARGITDKLIRRHPHVFVAESASAELASDVQLASEVERAETAADVEATWDARKAKEKGRLSVTDGVPLGMPSLVLAAKLQGRAKRAGIDVEIAPKAVRRRAVAVLDVLDDDHATEEFGEFLFALVEQARRRGIDPDASLRGAVRNFRDHVIQRERVDRERLEPDSPERDQAIEADTP